MAVRTEPLLCRICCGMSPQLLVLAARKYFSTPGLSASSLSGHMRSAISEADVKCSLFLLKRLQCLCVDSYLRVASLYSVLISRVSFHSRHIRVNRHSLNEPQARFFSLRSPPQSFLNVLVVILILCDHGRGGGWPVTVRSKFRWILLSVTIVSIQHYSVALATWIFCRLSGSSMTK